MAKIRKFICSKIKSHVQLFLQLTNPIHNSKFIPIDALQNHFQFILAIYLTVIYIGIIDPIYLYSDCKFSSIYNQLTNNGIVFTHQISPRSIRHEMDFVFTLDISASMAIYLSFLIFKPLSPKFVFLQTSQNEVLVGNHSKFKSIKIFF